MQPEAPFVLSVVGLKKSGKTTVAASLIAGLSSRGLAVAALKRSHLPDLTLDSRGTDSSRLLEAGARFMAVRSRNQTLTVERHAEAPPSADLLELVPPSVRLVVGEGLFPAVMPAGAPAVPAPAAPAPLARPAPTAPAPTAPARPAPAAPAPPAHPAPTALAPAATPRRAIVCLRRFEELEETLRVRGVRPEEVLALAGVAAGGATRHSDYPVFDVLDPHSAEALCELVLATAGLASPGPRPPSGR